MTSPLALNDNSYAAYSAQLQECALSADEKFCELSPSSLVLNPPGNHALVLGWTAGNQAIPSGVTGLNRFTTTLFSAGGAMPLSTSGSGATGFLLPTPDALGEPPRKSWWMIGGWVATDVVSPTAGIQWEFSMLVQDISPVTGSSTSRSIKRTYEVNTPVTATGPESFGFNTLVQSGGGFVYPFAGHNDVVSRNIAGGRIWAARIARTP